MTKRPGQTRSERMYQILGLFGDGLIDAAEFVKLINEHGFRVTKRHDETDDIDLFLEGRLDDNPN